MFKRIIYIIIFIISLTLVIKGNEVNDHKGLIMMLIGLVGLLIELHLYNKQYQ